MSTQMSLTERVKSALESEDAKAKARAILGTSPNPAVPAIASPQAPPAKCLLLDVSGSMAVDVEPGVSAWQALGTLAAGFAGVKRVAFSSAAQIVTASILPPPGGSTNMAEGFRCARRIGVRSAVLITDGLPDSEEEAIREAKGLRLDIFYVGAGPKPAFLDRLAAATGGTAQQASLKSSAKPALEAKMRTMLALPAPGGSK